jgi:hypothetical protein
MPTMTRSGKLPACRAVGLFSWFDRIPEELQMSKIVVVDEGVGQNTALWREFQRTFGDEPFDYLFLSEAHPGIPDVEILDKILKPGMLLLTSDCVLHEHAIRRGVRSYTLNQQGSLTRQRKSGVTVKPLAQSVLTDLQDDYRHKTEHEITDRLHSSLTEKQFKRYRTARRRIRSYFGSAPAISQVALTVGSRAMRRGLLCGFVMHVAGNSGKKGLRASEGYCLPLAGAAHAALPMIHALRDLYLLQLEQVRCEMFVIPPESLALSRHLLESPEPDVSDPLIDSLMRLLRTASCLTVHPCVKGRYFDSMQSKLEQLDRSGSNEVTAVDFANLSDKLRSVDFSPHDGF